MNIAFGWHAHAEQVRNAERVQLDQIPLPDALVDDTRETTALMFAGIVPSSVACLLVHGGQTE